MIHASLRRRLSNYDISNRLSSFFSPPSLFLSITLSLSLFLFFRLSFFIRATIEKLWTVGRVTSGIFDRNFFLWIFLWTSVDFTREGGLNNTKNERCMHNDFTTSLCVIDARSITANRIILSNEICDNVRDRCRLCSTCIWRTIRFAR